jgi:transcription initiation factor TFIIIB Brf1 subunit/transcription initiation factor TFIIB
MYSHSFSGLCLGLAALPPQAYGSASRGNSRYGFSRESREATLANARRNIAQVASSLRLPSYFIDRAQRLYSLALQRNFVYGRRQMHIVATVLYTICRQEKSPHLLIDFSDVLQVNVYTLGKSFLQLTKILNLNLMVVDPSLYIHRFATRLDLGDKVGAVSTTAMRIVTRMKKDWINTGPSLPPLPASPVLTLRQQGDDQMGFVRQRCYWPVGLSHFHTSASLSLCPGRTRS